MKNTVITIAVMAWAAVTFIALIAEAETLTSFVILKALAFASAFLCMKVCKSLERRGVFNVEDNSEPFQ